MPKISNIYVYLIRIPIKWSAVSSNSSGSIDTTIRMHHLDANKTYGEKTWRQLHENAASNIEQVLETAPHTTATVRPPTIRYKNYQN